MNRIFKIISFIMIVLIIATSLVACVKDHNKKTSPTTVNTTNMSQAEIENTYPINTEVTLSYWTPLNSKVSANYASLGDTPFAKELEKRTGVKINYMHSLIGNESEALNLMIASMDLPDIIDADMSYFSGGPETLIGDNIILKLNDIIDQYAPNFKKILQIDAELDKMVRTDESSYFGFPYITDTEEDLCWRGPGIRKDWLDELGLQLPETIEEWYTALKAFKEKKNVIAPFSWNGSGTNALRAFSEGSFIGAYGVYLGFYQENGKVKYGPYEKEYKDFLATMAKWYKEKLIDQNFASTDKKGLDANIINGNSGATILNRGGGFTLYIPALEKADPKSDLQPTAFPVLNKGDKPKFGHWLQKYRNIAAVITSKCRNVKIAAKWLDYGYTEEGSMLNNYGIENVSYTIKNGIPKFTDEVLKNPDGKPVDESLAQYARIVYSGPFATRSMYNQLNIYEAQRNADLMWPKTDMVKHVMPPVTHSKNEGTQYSKIMNDVDTYLQEYSVKVIMGIESLNNFDAYIGQLKNTGIEDAISIQQTALDRYKRR
ncbi:MAG TPA: extracellular solute-binding protein [Clostridiales bacterium]|nr:extracellular solute-binding protein [Clostridiales bacterium]